MVSPVALPPSRKAAVSPPGATPPTPSTPPPGPADLVPFVVAALVALALLGGVAGGLARVGIGPADAWWSAPALAGHAALMIGAFFGSVIGVERAVALRARWAYVAPLASGAAAACLLAGADFAARELLALASLVFVAVNVALVVRQFAAHSLALLAGAAAWLVGNVVYAVGDAALPALPWWFAFLVLTIAAERLEMTRLARRRRAAQPAFWAVVALLGAGAAWSLRDARVGGAVYGAALVLLGGWLLAFDIARRTVLATGLPRYIAVCLLAGYGWLVVGGLAWIAAAVGVWQARDAAYHALGLGFVFGMVFGHAPVILPAVARVKLLYGPWFYAPLALLHASLLLRLTAVGDGPWRAGGAWGNAAALALFAATAAASAWGWRRRHGSARRAGGTAAAAPPAPAVDRTFALWRLGFRPFYLLAAAFGALSVALWALQIGGALDAPYLRGPHWHAHEMVFGFALAVIVGFLFTAGRNWTGQPTPTGMPLALLAALWLAGRVLVATPWGVAAAVVNVAFPLAAAAALVVPFWRARNTRNYFFVALLVALAAAQAVFHAAQLGAVALPGFVGIVVALDVVLFILVVMAGRVVPMFTNNAVPGALASRRPWLEKVALGAVLALLATDALAIGGWPLAVVAFVGAVAHVARWLLWQPWKTLRQPLVWVLHVAYAWIPLHLALRAAAAAGWIAPSLATHALAVGALGGLVVGMITRTARGHTGRRLVADRSEVACYVLVALAAVVRALVPLLWPTALAASVAWSAALWSAAFGLYALRYWTVLTRPRLDGQPG